MHFIQYKLIIVSFRKSKLRNDVLSGALYVLKEKATYARLCKWLIIWWAQQDLNLWPADYESAALTV